MRSFEPGEDWSWCYVDQLFFEPAVQPRWARRQPHRNPGHYGPPGLAV